jgi:2-methylisocitrate lyase-like PEP mutase family enzyme
MMANPKLKAMLDSGEFFYAPAAQDMIAATVARRHGFDALYASGYWLTASGYGLPDAGLASYTQMLERIALLVRCAGDTPVIADADTGYGGLLNVDFTVRGYEDAGVTAIQLEDQDFPKKCGHTPNRRIIPAELMATKIRVAVDARRDPNFLIIARTDALANEGYEATMARAELYAEAGADIIFVEAMTDRAQMADACKRIKKPMIANMANGGKTEILTIDAMKEIGFACAIFPSLSSLAAAAAMDHAYATLKQTGVAGGPDVPLFDFYEFSSMIGFEEVWAFERKWADAEQASKSDS